MKNLYKQLDIFTCVHEAHQGFESRMSVHHILNKKRCYPHGCFYIQWHCKLFKQGKNCYRGYKQMGKNCPGCRYFYEEKRHNHPELQVPAEKFERFQQELRQFEDWLSEHLHREVEIHGEIDGVKPLFHKRIYHKGEGLSFSGFLLIFRQLYFGYELMDDHVYVRLSPKAYKQLKFGHGDVISAKATLTLNRGRLVLKKLRRIDIERRGEPPLWSESEALVAREIATLVPIQPEGCIQCPFGSLVDVEDFRDGSRQAKQYRQLYCLRGMKDYRICPDYYRYSDGDEKKQRLPLNSASCMTRKVNVTLKL